MDCYEILSHSVIFKLAYCAVYNTVRTVSRPISSDVCRLIHFHSRFLFTWDMPLNATLRHLFVTASENPTYLIYAICVKSSFTSFFCGDFNDNQFLKIPKNPRHRWSFFQENLKLKIHSYKFMRPLLNITYIN